MLSPADVKAHYRNLRESDIARLARKFFKDRIRRDTPDLLEIDCPHHASQSHHSLHVYPPKGLWHCFGCGVGGDIIHLAEFYLSGEITKNQSGSMPELHRRGRELVENEFGVGPLSQQGLSPEEMAEAEKAYLVERRVRALHLAVAEFYHRGLKNNPQALEWFRSHYAISWETIESLKIGYAEKNGIVPHLEGLRFTLREMTASGLFRPTNQDGVLPVFENRVVFPYWNGPVVTYMIARRTPWTPDTPYEQGKYKKLPVHDKGKHKYIDPCIRNDYLFNEDLLLARPKELIITEGITDCLALMERNFPAISPVTVKIREEDWERLIPKFRNVGTIYLSLDNEVSHVGLNASIKTASLLAKHHIQAKLVILPLDEKQFKARRELSDRFGINAGGGVREAIKRLNLSGEEVHEVDRLAADSKIDVNEYFAAGHLPDEYKELLKKAQTPLEFAISNLKKDISEEERNRNLEPLLAEVARQPDLEQERLLKTIQEHFGKEGLPISALRSALRAVKKEQRTHEKREDNRKFDAKISGGSGVIDVTDLNLPEVTRKAWDAVNKANSENNSPYLFRHVIGLVRIEKNENGEPVIRSLTDDRLRHELARVAIWVDARQGTIALPPMHVVRDMLANPDPPLPSLERIVEAPFFSKNGVLHSTPGYLKETECYYYRSSLPDLPPLPPKPSRSDIEQSLALIEGDLLGDFPFTGLPEKAHAIALVIQPFIRKLIPGPTPMYLVESPTPGTGKGLLVKTACYPALGRDIPSMAEGRDEDEFRKRITAALSFSPAFMFVDNVRTKIDSAAWASAITSTVWEDRILGQSQIVRLPVTSGWVVAANNPDLSSEMARRIIRIRLDAKMDRPWMREGFTHPDILGWAKENRARLVIAILTLVQAWISKGCPKPSSLPPLGTFEDWSRVMGGVLQVIGVRGFLGNIMEVLENSDREGELKRAFTLAWWEKYGEQGVGVSELYALVIERDIPVDLGRGASERSQKTKFGMWLSKLRDNQIGFLRIVNVGVRHQAQVWKLQAVASKKSGTSSDAELVQDSLPADGSRIDLADFEESE